MDISTCIQIESDDRATVVLTPQPGDYRAPGDSSYYASLRLGKATLFFNNAAQARDCGQALIDAAEAMAAHDAPEAA